MCAVVDEVWSVLCGGERELGESMYSREMVFRSEEMPRRWKFVVKEKFTTLLEF
jgi:hypothetical protein